MPRRLLIGLGLGAAASVLALTLAATSLDDALEAETYDWRVSATAPPAGETPVAIIEINESSIRALDPIFGRWPWPRLVHASVVDFLAGAGARVIAYDVLFTEEDTRGTFEAGGLVMDGPLSDRALADSVRRAGNVVLLADATFEGLAADDGPGQADLALRLPGVIYAPGDGFQPRGSVRLPFESLLAAAAGVGHNFLAIDADGSTRRIAPFIDVGGTALPSLGLAAALAARRVPAGDVELVDGVLRVGDRRLPVQSARVPSLVAGEPPVETARALLRFRRPVIASDGIVTTYRAYSFFDVLLSQDRVVTGGEPVIDPAMFRDRVVFVGTTAAGLKDVITTPFDDTGGAGGVLVHATLADNVLSGFVADRAGRGVDAGVTLLAGLASGAAAALLPVGWAVAAVAGLAVALAIALTRAEAAGLWIGAVPPMAAAALALFGGVAWRYFVEDRAKRRIRELFGRYVSSDVIRQLEEDPARAGLGGQRREMTVLFSDIRGFTAASERGTPEEVVAQLNEYFGAMVEVLFRHRGTLDKFVGDMVMGLFGAPLDDPRHADHAVAAALEMTAVLDRLNAGWVAAGRPRLDIGIGINTGEMVAGNIGSSAIMSYTVIGDAVNLGARLESLNKEYGTRILISQATKDALTTPVVTRRIGEVTVKGKSQPVVVHEVTGGGAGEQAS